MDPSEVGFADVGRLEEEMPPDIVRPTADPSRSRVPRQQNLSE